MNYNQWLEQRESLLLPKAGTIVPSGDLRTLSYQDWLAESKALGYAPISDDPAVIAFGQELGKGVIRGFLNVGKGLVGTAEALIPGRQETLLEAKERIVRTTQRIPVTHDDWSGFAGRVIGEAIPYMGSALAGGYAIGPVGAGLVGFSVEGDDAYDRAKAGGASESGAQLERGIVGSINAAIEALQINRLMKFHKAGRYSLRGFTGLIRTKAYRKAIKEGLGFTAEILQTSFAEALEEASQEGVSIAVPAIFRGDVPRRPSGRIDWNAIVKQIGMSGLAGGIAGATFGISGAAISEIAGTRVITEEETARLIELDKELEGKSDLEGKYITLMSQRRVATRKERKRIAALRTIERGKRIGEAEGELMEGPEEWRYFKALSKLRGELPSGFFDPLGDDLSIEDQENLRYDIRMDENLRGFEKVRCEKAFNKTLAGDLPSPGEIRLLEKHFGRFFASQLLKHRPLGQKAYSGLIESLNIPRTLMASCDISHPLRQGVILAVRHPKIWGKHVGIGYKILFGNKYFWNNPQKYADSINESIKNNRWYNKAAKYIDFAEIGTTQAKRAEEFISDLAKKIPDIGPLVGRSELAFVTQANKLRMDYFSHYANKWEEGGYNPTNKDYALLGHLANIYTGRGDIKFLQKHAPFLNAVFFSPRFVASRIQTATMLGRSFIPGQMSWAIRKILWADLASFVGAGIGLLGLLSLVKGADVEDDPRSTDFGKVRIGDTRVDIWGGYSPLARLTAQLWTGQRKATDTGEVYDIDHKEIIGRFIRSKLAPVPGVVHDVATGTTFEGDEISTEAAAIGDLLVNNLVPLAAQDIIDAGYYSRFYHSLLVAPLAFHGVGAQTYPISPYKRMQLQKDQISKSTLGKKWNELGPDVQEALREARPQIRRVEIETASERAYKYDLNRMRDEQKASASLIVKSLSKPIQDELERNYVVMPGINRRLGKWFLNDERYEKYVNLTSKYMNRVLPLIIKSGEYQRLDVLSKSHILQDVITRCKKEARRQITAEANVGDILSLKDYLGR